MFTHKNRRVKTLKPQPLRESDYADIRRQLESIFYEIIFKPVVALLAPHNRQVRDAKELRNAVEDPIVVALKSGRVQYNNGVFTGQFDSRISKSLKAIGAAFNKTSKAFTLDPKRVPPAVLAMAHTYQQTARKLHVDVVKGLDSIEDSLDHLVDVHVVDAGTMVSKVQKGFEESVGDALGNKDLTDESREKLKKEYAESLKPWIKKFSAESIHELREQVEANALAGYRFDTLVDRIQSRHAVSKSKAAFLARQETALYVSKHRRTRFEESGVTQYVWRTAGGPRVRDDHKHLEGKIFSYDTPPIVDSATGRRGNPGEDFNCLPVGSGIEVAYGIEKAFRRRYRGDLTEVVTSSGKSFRATPNHPVLTLRGWCPVGLLQESDKIAELSDDLFGAAKMNFYRGIPTIDQVFSSFARALPTLTASSVVEDFHGDGTNGHIEVVRAAWGLTLHGQIRLLDGLEKFLLSVAEESASAVRAIDDYLALFFRTQILPADMALAGEGAALVQAQFRHPEKIGLRARARFDAIFEKKPANHAPAETEATRNGEFTFPLDVRLDDRSSINFVGVRMRKTSFYDGHVFNFTTKRGFYTTGGVVASNCRCVDSPVLPHISNFFTDADAKVGDPDDVRENSLFTPQLQECAS